MFLWNQSLLEASTRSKKTLGRDYRIYGMRLWRAWGFAIIKEVDTNADRRKKIIQEIVMEDKGLISHEKVLEELNEALK